MGKIALFVIKIATFLTAAMCLFLTTWSVFKGMPLLLTVSAAALTALFGYMSYTDVRNALKK